VAKLLPLGSSNEGVATVYFHKNRSNNLHMSQPSQFTGNAWNKGGDDYYYQNVKEDYLNIGQPSEC